MKILLLFGASFFLFLGSSCKKYQPADPAFFLRAGKITVATTSKQGSGSHKITDLWLYVDGQFQGIYPVGHLMPIVSNHQKVKITVLAGIKNNGISDTRIYWNLYEKYEFDTLVESGTTIERPFTFHYWSSVVMPMVEGFEGGVSGFKIQKSPDSDTVFYLTTPEESMEGNAIQMGLSGRSLVGKMESAISYSVPHAKAEVYLEFNYKCSVEFEAGVIGDDLISVPALIIGPKSEWNKIYVQLATVVNAAPLSDKYKIYFRFLNKDVPEPRIFLDNIKLVHFP